MFSSPENVPSFESEYLITAQKLPELYIDSALHNIKDDSFHAPTLRHSELGVRFFTPTHDRASPEIHMQRALLYERVVHSHAIEVDDTQRA